MLQSDHDGNQVRVSDVRGQFEVDGYLLLPALLGPGECHEIARHLVESASHSGGTRSLLSRPWCAALASQLRRNSVLGELLPPGAVAVQCTYFQKSAAKNWLVAMHQDLSIPVASRVEHEALHGWTHKEGMLYVQAPRELLRQMIAVRIHVDACTTADGPLRVIPGSHTLGAVGMLKTETTPRQEVTCVAARGDALLMRPLLLHASSKAAGTGMRRVLHFVFGPPDPSYGLRWHITV